MEITPSGIHQVWQSFMNMCESQKLKVAVTSNGKGAMVAGAGAFAGGMLMGPIGMALGGLLGGAVGGVAFKSESVIPILMNMTESEKRQFVQSLTLSSGNQYALETLAALLISSPEIRKIAIGILQEVLKGRGMALQY